MPGVASSPGDTTSCPALPHGVDLMSHVISGNMSLTGCGGGKKRRRLGPEKQLQELGLEPAVNTGRRALGTLDDAGDVTVVGLIQKEGAEDIVEECGVVSAGSLAVRVEVHLQDLGLHHPLSWWQN